MMIKDPFDSPHPPHDESPYHCGCTGCEAWRARRVVSGSLVAPATKDPKQYSGGGDIPAWEPGEWSKTGWNFRMEQKRITHGLVIGFVEKDDRENAGHLDCVFILCNDGKIRVTSRKWLTVI